MVHLSSAIPSFVTIGRLCPGLVQGDVAIGLPLSLLSISKMSMLLWLRHPCCTGCLLITRCYISSVQHSTLPLLAATLSYLVYVVVAGVHLCAVLTRLAEAFGDLTEVCSKMPCSYVESMSSNTTKMVSNDHMQSYVQLASHIMSIRCSAGC